MRVLFIGPLPEPTTGQSLACKVLLDALSLDHQVRVVNLSKPELASGFTSWLRVTAVLGLLQQVWRQRNAADIIYLTVAESVGGNLKDLAIYTICSARLGQLFVHLHGGSLKAWIFDRHPLLRLLNRFFLRRIGGAIVLGKSHLPIFEGMVPDHKVHVVPNFALDALFTTHAAIVEKFSRGPVRVLFLSNLISGKGYEDLVQAYCLLSPQDRKKMEIDFCGAFESDADRERFLKSIDMIPNIRYHGVVLGPVKTALLHAAHVFCLPTGLLEGQPISILEAYAAGCVVLTTHRGGIPDIFSDGINGYQVEPQRPQTLKEALQRVLAEPQGLPLIARHNFELAGSRYRTTSYVTTIANMLARAARGSVRANLTKDFLH